MAAEHDTQTVKTSGKSINCSRLDVDRGNVCPIYWQHTCQCQWLQLLIGTEQCPFKKKFSFSPEWLSVTSRKWRRFAHFDWEKQQLRPITLFCAASHKRCLRALFQMDAKCWLTLYHSNTHTNIHSQYGWVLGKVHLGASLSSRHKKLSGLNRIKTQQFGSLIRLVEFSGGSRVCVLIPEHPQHQQRQWESPNGCTGYQSAVMYYWPALRAAPLHLHFHFHLHLPPPPCVWTL